MSVAATRPHGRRGVRIGNCSGYYGDRPSAMREMLEGGDLDYLTGDYLAELTMLILGRDLAKDASLGYAKTFVGQAEECLGLAKERGVRIVSNAGGLNPAGLAARLREISAAQGLGLQVAHVDGDDLRHRADELGFGRVLTANAYLGAFGIAEALAGGADVVVMGRVTDASVVVGPAVAHHGWGRTDLDALAGAVVAGHVIECGTQATGGNFSGFGFIDVSAPLGFPIAEVAADGSSVITKHQGTGGAVTVDTVTAQLLYEVQGPVYLNPDVATNLDSIVLEQVATDRVAITGVSGSPPPATLKVCLNTIGGYRNRFEFALTGLDIEHKAAWIRRQMEAALASAPPEQVEWHLDRTDVSDPPTQALATAVLRLDVRSSDAAAVGRRFTDAAVNLALASYPGFSLSGAPAAGAPYGVYRAATVDQQLVPHVVHHHDGATTSVAPPPVTAPVTDRADDVPPAPPSSPHSTRSSGAVRRVPLGELVHARSGDKGGNANVGVWIPAVHPDRDRAVDWLTGFLDAAAVRALLPEAGSLEIDVHPLPNLGGVNVVIHGLLGEGVASSTRFDPQAKAVGEWLRARFVDVPEEILRPARATARPESA